jgi:hypothetical protein
MTQRDPIVLDIDGRDFARLDGQIRRHGGAVVLTGIDTGSDVGQAAIHFPDDPAAAAEVAGLVERWEQSSG